jgi:hypothetical protein
MEMFCQKCGTDNTDGGSFCATCGTPLEAPVNAPAPVVHQQSYQQPPPPPGYPPQGAYQQPHYQQPPAQQGFIGEVFSKSFAFLFKKPMLLWGLSLIFALMVWIAIVGSLFIPMVWFPIVAVLFLGMCNIFIRGYRGQEISATLLFEGFGKGRFLRNAGGIGWMELWILIWALIPIVGPIFAVIKGLSYCFVPFIMLNEPDIQATEALKKSMAMTDGYKSKMFWTFFLMGLCVGFAIIVLVVISIPMITLVITIPALLIIYALLPLLYGTVFAVMYDKVSREKSM